MSLVDEIDKDLRKDTFMRTLKYFSVVVVGTIVVGVGIFYAWDYNIGKIKSQCRTENLSETQCSTVTKLMKKGASWNPNAMTFDEALMVIKK